MNEKLLREYLEQQIKMCNEKLSTIDKKTFPILEAGISGRITAYRDILYKLDNQERLKNVVESREKDYGPFTTEELVKVAEKYPFKNE